MGRKKAHAPEEIVAKLRQSEVLIGQGKTVADAVRAIGVTEPTYYRWRAEFGGLKLDQVKRLKELERENARLRKAVSDLTLDPERRDRGELGSPRRWPPRSPDGGTGSGRSSCPCGGATIVAPTASRGSAPPPSGPAVSETDYLSVIRTLDATRRRGVISQGDIAEPRCGVTSLARRDEAPPLQPGPAALVTRVSPSRPGDGADGQVADLLGRRPGCDGPLKFRSDHSMGPGHQVAGCADCPAD
jgi:hypothetical protein